MILVVFLALILYHGQVTNAVISRSFEHFLLFQADIAYISLKAVKGILMNAKVTGIQKGSGLGQALILLQPV